MIKLLFFVFQQLPQLKSYFEVLRLRHRERGRWYREPKHTVQRLKGRTTELEAELFRLENFLAAMRVANGTSVFSFEAATSERSVGAVSRESKFQERLAIQGDQIDELRVTTEKLVPQTAFFGWVEEEKRHGRRQTQTQA